MKEVKEDMQDYKKEIVSDDSQNEKPTCSKFERVLERYIELINTQDRSLPVITNILLANAKTWSDRLSDFITKYKIDEKKEEDNMLFSLPLDKAAKFQKLLKEQSCSLDSLNLAVSNIVVAIVSLYDYFFSELVRLYYTLNPSVLDISKKQFSAEQVLCFDTIEDFRNSLIEKEIETILRDSHTDQIEWLEKKLEIPLTKGLSVYPEFVEITERRNLFVHANGRVSKQYIKECNRFNVKGIDEIKEECTLKCTPNYANKCYTVFFEIGVKLGIVMWHKLKPEEYEEMYAFIDPVCFNLIREKKYPLALKLLDFMLTTPFKKDCPYAYKLVFTINKALVYHLQGDKKKACDIVTRLDCSAAEEIYRMAVSILKDDTASALQSMKEIGKNVKMRDAYKEWPLFTSIRDTEEFKKLYQEIYEEEYQYDEIPSTDFDKLLHNALEMHKKHQKNNKPKSSDK